MTDESIPLSPVSGWEISTVPAYGAVMVRLAYLTNVTQTTGQAHQSPTFALLAPQCRELIAVLQAALVKLESGPPEGTGLPKH